jgi:hypothetical protein
MKMYNYYKLGLPNGNTITTGDNLNLFFQECGFDIPLLQPLMLIIPARPTTPYNPADNASRREWNNYSILLNNYRLAQPAAMAEYNQQFVEFAEYLQVVFVMARKVVIGIDGDGRNIIGWRTDVAINYTWLQAARLLILRFGTLMGDDPAIDFICNGQFG